MRLTLIKSIQILLLLLVAHLCHAQTGFKLKQVLSGANSQLVKDASVTVNDSLYFNAGSIPKLDTPYQVRNIITFSINEYSPLYLPASFTASAQVRIYYTLSNSSIDSADQTLNINYDTASSYTSRSSFVFNNAHKVKIKVLGITSPAGVLPALMLENEMEVHPRYKLSRTDDAIKSLGAVSFANTDSTDEVNVSWPAITGADVYDLEWAYIDSSALSRYSDPKLIFENNTTRVTVSASKYAIPLFYDNGGVLFYRVRAVQEKEDYRRFETAWSSDYTLGKVGFTGHQRKLNWQSAISFAEEGKRKVVVQYFDGSLRSRQTVTKDNTTNTTVVAETFYDYQGRPAVQVLPAPTLNTVLKYARNVNSAMNGVEYDKDHYDHISQPSDYITGGAEKMSSDSGANRYYSPNNPEKNIGINQFIPDAQGYAFTETEYEPDGTGRIRRQGGVGPTFQLGSGHETQYLYGNPSQEDLDALFGTEAGDKSHYFKDMVRDANGQYAVTYTDMHGRTIATALAGSPANASLTDLTTKDVIKVTDSLSGAGKNNITDFTISNTSSLVITQDDTVTFHYKLTPPVLQKMGCDASKAYKGVYDLVIRITDDSYNLHLGGQPYETVLHITDPVDITFSKYLVKGTYEISKTLQVNKSQMDYYRDSVFMKGLSCKTEQQFISEQQIEQRKKSCAPDCASCLADVGTWDSFRVNYVVSAGNDIKDTASYRGEAWTAYQEALSVCNDLCGKTTQTDDILATMLLDMSGPSGQYATVSDSTFKQSIFFRDEANPMAAYQRDTVYYLDDYGNPDKVYDENTNTYVTPQQLTPDQFALRFRSSWAPALLKFHPEYCKYLQMQKYAASEAWNTRFRQVDTYAQALDSSFLNPTGLAAYQTLFGKANTDPVVSAFSAAQLTAINNKLNGYSASYSLWSVATSSVKCGSNDKTCVDSYNTPAKAFGNTLCASDKDMAWRAFRDLYLNLKDSLINAAIMDCGGVKSGDLLKAGKLLRFSKSDDILDQGGLSGYVGSVDGNKATASATAKQDSLYDKNCKAYVKYWLQQLAPCKYTAGSDLDGLMNDLVAICRSGSDLTHTQGSSTVKPGRTGTRYRSFEEALNAYNKTHNIKDPWECNAQLITTPRPYDKQVAYSNIPSYAKPSDCQCDKLHDLQAEYNAVKKITDINLATYLKRTRGTSLTQSDLDVLLDACNQSSSNGCSWLPKVINIPPIMQCDVAPACVQCEEVATLYTQFKTAYPGITAVVPTTDSLQMQKNNLFAAYMNSHLGYFKEAWEYKEFIDSCAAHPEAAGTTVCKPFANGDGPRMTTQYADGNNQIKDIARTKTNGYIMAGIANANVAANADGYLIRTDSLGQVIWSKKYGGDQNDRFLAVKATADSGFIAIGTTYSYCYDNGAMLIVKVDGNGNVKWNKTVDVDAVTGAAGSDVIELTDGSYGFSGTARKSATGGAFYETDWITGVLTHEGELQWMKRWGSNLNANFVVSPSVYLLENKDTVVAASSTTHTGGNLNVVVFKASKTTGALIDTRSYELEKGSSNLISIAKTPAGYKMTIINFAANASTGSFAALDVAEGGGIIRATHLLRGGLAGAYRTSPTPDGGMMMARFDYNNPQHLYWYKLAPDNSLVWANHIKGDGPMRFIEKLIVNPNGTLAGAGILGSSNFAPSMLTLMNGVGKGSCKDVVTDTTAEIVSAVVGKGTAEDLSIQLTLGDKNINTIPLLERVTTLTRNIVGCAETENCYKAGDALTLCGNAEPIFAPVDVNTITNCSDSTFFAVSAGKVMYRSYIDSVKNDFDVDYTAKALSAAGLEQFAVTYGSSEYHYTLFYYDQAGNLVKTVPPAGVVKNRTKAWTDRVAVARAKGLRLAPQHTMITAYRYNTLNEQITQKTPDAGQSRFWYDRLGRIVVSQNAQQSLENHYSYTQYDSLGRITEIGEVTSITAMTDELSRKAKTLDDWMAAARNSKTQIVQTVYDQPLTPLSSEMWKPTNLRNRVSWSLFYNNYADFAAGNYVTGSFYSYDILGNVKTLLQDYKTIITGDRWKKINYDYDLISGKVNIVSYQPGGRDAFYHRYNYDAENRITSVATSRDSVYWENDAYYQYYKHGPLARTIIGKQQVQGIDYAYTLQGWLKGVNSTSSSFDMGADGSNGSVVARDAFGFALHYYGSEYSPVNTSKNPFATITPAKPLFNGNISAISQTISKLGEPLLYSYSYDVLNRLAGMQVAKGLNQSNNIWTPVNIPDYKESVSYDPNGNILKYNRQGNKAAIMDSMSYHYQLDKNRLDHITDLASSSAYDDDIDSQAPGNYAYDAIGNLIKDDSANITNIKWTVYGKIASISKRDGSTISYAYDVAGNRISKTAGGVQTWYVRDASGNVMSVYTKDAAGLSQTETHLYGSSRLGINTLAMRVDADQQPQSVTLPRLGSGFNTNFIRGKKFFELNNHLGNVLATVSDRKVGVFNGSVLDHYEADVVSAQEYYPFGMGMPGRGMSSERYRYGFNGKENDNEIEGQGNSLDFGSRVYDPRIGRFLSLDPRSKEYPDWSPYVYAFDNPIRLIDDNGEGPKDPMHHVFLTTVALDIYDAAKARGATGRGALLVMAQASIESGYGADATKRGDYNLFGVMTRGSDYKVQNAHGKIRDYSNNGKWKGSIDDYFEGKTRKWPASDDLIKKSTFTADDIDKALYTGKFFEFADVRIKTGHGAYNADNIDEKTKTNNNEYGSDLIKQMNNFKTRLNASLDYQINNNNMRIKEIDATLIGPGSGVLSIETKTNLSTEKTNLSSQNARFEAVKKDINQ